MGNSSANKQNAQGPKKGSDEQNQHKIEEMDQRNMDELNAALILASHTVYKQYLNELSAYSLVEPNAVLMDETLQDCVRAFRLTRLTCKKGEDIFQKLSTVYHAAMSLGCSLFLMIDVAGTNRPAELYLGIRNPDAQKNRLSTSYTALRDGLLSNFPGTEVEDCFSTEQHKQELSQKLDDIFGPSTKCVSAVSCVASARDKSKTEHKTFVQGIEKLIDVMRGKAYTAVFIAEPISPQQQGEMRDGYEKLYSTLAPFRKSVWSYNENNSHAVMESLSHGIMETVTEGTTQTQSHTVTQAKGSSDTFGIGLSGGFSKNNAAGTVTTDGKSAPTTKSKIGNAVGGVVGLIAGAAVMYFSGGAAAPAAGTVATAVGAGVSGVISAVFGRETQSHSVAESIVQSMGISANLSGNYAHGIMRSTGEADATAEATVKNEAKGTSDTSTDGTTDTTGTGRTLQVENMNKSIEELLKRIEEQIKRIREGEDYGAYSCGAYFLSGKQDSSLLAANTYRALMLGEGSAVESGAVNFWNAPQIVKPMKEYLRRFAQPIFALPYKEKDEGCCLVYSSGTIVSGLELPLHLGLPTKSVMGLPVIDHAEFGRNVLPAEHPLPLGGLYHMGQTERNAKVDLNINSLAAHTFITGSTGAGKSNTIYHMLDGLAAQDIHFLVIEPAKGEYKDVFGGREDVTVYGTNPFRAPNLLQINPFSFPEDVHVLEHIDRLVEVFNACWPMYAAMPAILRESVERAYEDCGWSLKTSRNPGRFPTFDDLLATLPQVVDSSAYSADTSNDYKGALVTRVRSLTRGIHGQIFSQDIPSSRLFDENVIVDLSRVGAQETKALIMGILVLKMQEHRMSENDGHNHALKHVTVLEEAHNLLRRTSSEQSQESSNLQGKSVEMLATAIAEMRTYGEGFVIADQSPGLMDMSVIRNTNTKIILRLPDESDRVLVGKAAGLTDLQVEELARLERGVAAVSQSDWLEPVLCRVDKFTDEKPMNKRFKTDVFAWEDSENRAVRRFLTAALDVEHLQLSKEDVDEIRRWSSSLRLSEKGRWIVERALEGDHLDEKEQLLVVYYAVGNKLGTIASRPDAISEMKHTLFGRYSIEESSEITHRATELFLAHFPMNLILNNTVEQTEKMEREGNPI